MLICYFFYISFGRQLNEKCRCAGRNLKCERTLPSLLVCSRVGWIFVCYTYGINLVSWPRGPSQVMTSKITVISDVNEWHIIAWENRG